MSGTNENDATPLPDTSREKTSYGNNNSGALAPTGGKPESFGLELLKIVLFAVIIVVPIRLFIAQPFVVSGASMEPTFESSEYLIVDQLSYRFEKPERGDVIIFRFPLDPSKFFIKRIIGLPGETVMLEGKTVTIRNSEYPDGWVLDEAYVSPKNLDDNTLSVTLDSDEYFVLGDNRRESSDSRSWGTLNERHIIGRAIVRLFPITHFDILPGT
ncbi:signal peptidase I [Candidatus Kaiserbacteria bacterium]|nr:signal peptidase I [Candidatus Kaiserbacteria bacterium]